MRSADIDTLKLLANTANDWRALALSQNVSLDILTTRINGEIVQLQWDPNMVMWEIRTADSQFQLRWVNDESVPVNSHWDVVSN
jgi:hypothetical protein